MVFRIKNIIPSLLILFSLVLISCGSSKPKSETELPSWVNNYKMIYPETSYLSSLGISEYKSMAEKQAFQGIAASFEMMIKSTLQSNEVTYEDSDSFSKTYKEVFDINTSVDQNLKNIKSSELYFDQKNNKYYVLATLNKSETASIYRQDRNELMRKAEYAFKNYVSATDDIQKLSYISESISYMIEIEKIDDKLMILENSSLRLMNFKDVEQLMKERKQLLSRINFYLHEDDEIIYKELKTELTEMGLNIVDNEENARIKVDQQVSVEDSSIKNPDAKFVNWTLNIEIIDLQNDVSITHYIRKGRSGQLSESAARERAYFDMVKKLNSDFKIYIIQNLLKVKK